MTLQWTAVATFLYVEIGILVILCLPFISAKRQVTESYRANARCVYYRGKYAVLEKSLAILSVV